MNSVQLCVTNTVNENKYRFNIEVRVNVILVSINRKSRRESEKLRLNRRFADLFDIRSKD